jgi:hypothetical protein
MIGTPSPPGKSNAEFGATDLPIFDRERADLRGESCPRTNLASLDRWTTPDSIRFVLDMARAGGQ